MNRKIHTFVDTGTPSIVANQEDDGDDDDDDDDMTTFAIEEQTKAKAKAETNSNNNNNTGPNTMISFQDQRHKKRRVPENDDDGNGNGDGNGYHEAEDEDDDGTRNQLNSNTLKDDAMKQYGEADANHGGGGGGGIHYGATSNGKAKGNGNSKTNNGNGNVNKKRRIVTTGTVDNNIDTSEYTAQTHLVENDNNQLNNGKTIIPHGDHDHDHHDEDDNAASAVKRPPPNDKNSFISLEIQNHGDGSHSALSSANSSPAHLHHQGNKDDGSSHNHQEQQQQQTQQDHQQQEAEQQQQHQQEYYHNNNNCSESVASIHSAASSTSSSSPYPVPPAPPSTPVAEYDFYAQHHQNQDVIETQDGYHNNYQEEYYHPTHQQRPDTTVATPLPKSQYDESCTSSSSNNNNNNNGQYNNGNRRANDTTRTTTTTTNASKPEGQPKNDDDVDMMEDFSKWKVGPRYELIRILGRGSYGEVAQARDTLAGGEDKFVAIKKITTAFEQEVDALRLFREIHILRKLRGHECIIQLLDIVPPESDSISDFQDLYLVFEYVDTDLYKLIMSPQYLTTAHIQTLLYQMLNGLKYLHSSSVIHRDLKPANILLNENCSLKICDFGLARIIDRDKVAKSYGYSSSSSNSNSDTVSDDGSSQKNPEKQGLTRQLTKHVVTRWYRAPELILIQPYSTAVDIWSIGCIFAELLSMQEESVGGYEDRVPLFPGGSCYPLSGDGESATSNERLDQLSVILGVIGTPSPEDIASIGDANEYIKTLKKSPSKNIDSLYPGADKDAIDLLKIMLQFNPKKRCTAKEALEHKFLKGIRENETEKIAEQPLVGPEFLNAKNIDVEELKRRTYEEVMWFKDQHNLNR